MRKTEIIEKYWEEFLSDCHVQLVTHAADDTDTRSKAEPTDNNFWAWYMKNKMEQDTAKIKEYLTKANIDNNDIG